MLNGGPVSPERGFILHADAGDYEATLRISEEIYLSMSRDAMTAMYRAGGPAGSVMILGYAGWEAAQLESEILAKAWLTVPATHRLVFDTPYEARWARAAKAHHRKFARIVALLDADHAQRAEHVLVDDIDDPARGVHQADAERIGDLLNCLGRAFAVKLETAA